MKTIQVDTEMLRQAIEKIDAIYNYVVTHPATGDDDQFYDSPEVCQLLNIHKRTLQRLRREKRIAYTQIGRKYLYRKKDIEILVQRKAVNCDNRHFIQQLRREGLNT